VWPRRLWPAFLASEMGTGCAALRAKACVALAHAPAPEWFLHDSILVSADNEHRLQRAAWRSADSMLLDSSIGLELVT